MIGIANFPTIKKKTQSGQLDESQIIPVRQSEDAAQSGDVQGVTGSPGCRSNMASSRVWFLWFFKGDFNWAMSL